VVEIDPNGSETIDGAASRSLNPNQAVELICDGANWKILADAASSVGLHTISIPAAALTPAMTNGCAAAAQAETATNEINYKYCAFDKDTVEAGWFYFRAPKSMKAGGTLTAAIQWTHPSTTSNFLVAWDIAILSLHDDDAMDTAAGTAIQVNDTGGTTEDYYETAMSTTITASNTFVKGDGVWVRIRRVATDGTNDTLAVDAHFINAVLIYETDANEDA
jgi:hypothetical protein